MQRSISKLVKIQKIFLGRDSVILRTNEKLLKMEKDEKNKRRLNNFKLSESGKSKLENLKSFFSKITKKKEEKSPGFKKSKSGDERSEEPQKTLLEKLNSILHCCTRRTMLEKLKSTFSCCKRKKIKNNPVLKKFSYGIKRSKNDIKKLDKSPRRYIKQKLKWVILFCIIYVIIFVAIVSIPITWNHLSVVCQNETKQERFISSYIY